MTEHRTARMSLTVWGLASLHSILLVFPVVLVLYSRDALNLGNDGDEARGTLIGLGLYAALWVSSWLGTWIALVHTAPDLDFSRLHRVLAVGAIGGGVSGAVFWGIGAVAIGLVSLIEGIQDAVPLDDLLNQIGLFAALATLGSVLAAAAGALVGIGVSLVEFVLFRAAAVLMGVTSEARPRGAAAP